MKNRDVKNFKNWKIKAVRYCKIHISENPELQKEAKRIEKMKVNIENSSCKYMENLFPFCRNEHKTTEGQRFSNKIPNNLLFRDLTKSEVKGNRRVVPAPPQELLHSIFVSRSAQH